MRVEEAWSLASVRTMCRKQRGRLKVCSESILFDPLDFADPVIKVIIKLVLNPTRASFSEPSILLNRLLSATASI